MIKNKVMLEEKIGDRVFELYLSPESTLGEVHDALHAMKATIIQRIVEANAETKKEEGEQCQPK